MKHITNYKLTSYVQIISGKQARESRVKQSQSKVRIAEGISGTRTGAQAKC